MNKVEIIGLNTSSLEKLSAAESKELMLKIKAGDESARERFIMGNIRLVLSVVQRFRRAGVSPDDMFQMGCVGLLKAVNNFDISQNVRFSTYAVPMIIGEIRRFLRDTSGIKVSRSLRDTAYKALKAREELVRSSFEGSVTLAEISEEIGISASEIACALDAVSDTVSYYEPVFGDEDDAMMLMDQLGDKKNTDESWLEHISLGDALKKVSDKEREILYLRYYLGKTQIEISREIKISQAQVSRLEKNAVAKMRGAL